MWIFVWRGYGIHFIFLCFLLLLYDFSFLSLHTISKQLTQYTVVLQNPSTMYAEVSFQMEKNLSIFAMLIHHSVRFCSVRSRHLLDTRKACFGVGAVVVGRCRHQHYRRLIYVLSCVHTTFEEDWWNGTLAVCASTSLKMHKKDFLFFFFPSVCKLVSRSRICFSICFIHLTDFFFFKFNSSLVQK